VLALTLGPLGLRAIFSVLNTLYLRPFPYQDPARVVAIYPANPYLNEDFGFLPIKYARWRETAKSLASISAYRWENVELDAGSGHTDTGRAGRVTASLFRTLGASAAHGRVLEDGDCRPGANRWWRSVTNTGGSGSRLTPP